MGNSLRIIPDEQINKHRCVRLIVLIALNNMINSNNMSLAFHIKWVNFTQCTAIGQNFSLESYNYAGVRMRDVLNQTKVHSEFFNCNLPIYEYLRIENPRGFAMIYLSDVVFNEYCEICKMCNIPIKELIANDIKENRL